MSRPFAPPLVAALAFLCLVPASLADDWTAVRLRGEVFVYRDGWVKLERGDVVSDDSIIRTVGRGRVSFERGAETIDLLPDSQIRIVDQTGRRFTTVMSDYGGVEIDAEVENVQHFSVATPFLAAVVKGTHFSVTSDDNGSEVSVQRGQVFVEDATSHDTVTIVAGETASTSTSSTPSGDTLVVTGTPKAPAAQEVVVTAPPSPDSQGSPVTGSTESTSTTTTSTSTPSDPQTPPPSPPQTPATTLEPAVTPPTTSPSPGNDGPGNSGDNSGPGHDNGNHNGHDNDNSGPGNNNGNANDNSGPGNNNGNDNSGSDHDNGNHHGDDHDHGDNSGDGNDNDNGRQRGHND